MGSTLAAAAIAPWLTARASRWGPRILGAQQFVSFLFLLRSLPQIRSGQVLEASLPWLQREGVSVAFTLDGLSLLFALLVTGVGSLVLVYTGAYLRDSPHLGRHSGLLLLFAAAMLGIVLADDLLVLFVSWELTGITSWLLIGTHADEKRRARDAANQALVVTAFGGLALFVAVILLWHGTGTTRISAIHADDVKALAHPEFVLLLFAVAGFAKSAQFPFHFWLPAAMEAPTPTSAYLHSATMVKAGVYLFARLSPDFAWNGLWSPLLGVAGLLTLLVGGWGSLRAEDLKRVLANATITVLGALVLLLSFATPLATKAAVLLVVAHAGYKAALFMVAGALDHAVGTRHLPRLRTAQRFASALPLTATAMALGCLSLLAVPPSLAYYGKEVFLEAVLPGPAWHVPALVVGMLALATLVAVALRIFVEPFVDHGQEPLEPQRLSAGLTIPALVLGLVPLAIGFAPSLLAAPWAEAASTVVHPKGTWHPIRFWAGWKIFALSVGVLVLGVLFWRVSRRRQVHEMQPAGTSGSDVYDRIYEALHAGAVRFTRAVQVGQMTVYVAVVVGVAAVAGLLPVLDRPVTTLHLLRDVLPHEVVLVGLFSVAAVFAARTRSPLSSVIALAVVGYGVALVFLLFGAVDLAVTQVLFETLVTLLFLLIVPRLPLAPDHAERPGRRFSANLVSVLFGLMLTLVALQVLAEPAPREMARWFEAAAAPVGRSESVVNAIITDFRVADTLGEAMVLVVSGVGVLVLLSAAKRLPPESRHPFRSGRPLVLRSMVDLFVALLVLYAFFLVLRGHQAPGGGFIAGLVAATAVAVHAIAHDAEVTRERLRVQPERFVPVGIGFIIFAGLIGAFFRGVWLQPVWSGLHLEGATVPPLGTPLLFEIGLFAMTFGVASMALLRIAEVP